jgi:integrase
VYGLLRPGEFLADGYYRFRSPLPATALVFRRSLEHSGPLELLPAGASLAAHAAPARLDFTLGATKADQFATNERVIIAAPMCVRAVWQWAHVRRDRGHAPHAPFFVGDDGMALSKRALLAEVERWLTRLQGAAPKVTGRAFRRGGATGMLAQGASGPDIMAAGRWRTAAMVGVYTSAEAQRRRAAEASLAMDPTARPAAAAAAAHSAR